MNPPVPLPHASLPPSHRHRTRTARRVVLACAAAAGLVAWASPASSTPPPAYAITDALPDLADARFTLESRMLSQPATSQTRTDLAWLLQADRIVQTTTVPVGRRLTVEQVVRINAWWYGTRDAPTARVILYGTDGVLFNYRKGYGFVFNPVATAGRWRKLNSDVPVEKLATSLAPFAVKRKIGGTRWLAFEYYDDRERPTEFLPGTSGMAQARVAQVFAAAWTKTGDPRFARMAARTIDYFTVPNTEGGGRALLASPKDGARLLWYPERVYPGEDPWKGAALNGFMAALIDLYTVSTRLGMPVANHRRVPRTVRSSVRQERKRALLLADQGTASVAKALPLHDTGTWSLYGLRAAGYGSAPLVADLNYHCYHIALLRALERRAPGFGFIDRARVWQSYVNRRGLKCPARPHSGETPDPFRDLAPEPDLPPLSNDEPPDPPPASLVPPTTTTTGVPSPTIPPGAIPTRVIGPSPDPAARVGGWGV